MQYNTLAPELSATVNLVSGWIIGIIPSVLNSFFDDFIYPPSFGSAKGFGFGDDYLVTNLARIAFIVGSKL
jgi:hypothetical protein